MGTGIANHDILAHSLLVLTQQAVETASFLVYHILRFSLSHGRPIYAATQQTDMFETLGHCVFFLKGPLFTGE